MSKKELLKIENLFYLIIAVAFVCALLNVPPELTNWIVNALVGLIVGSLCSLVAGSLVEAITGDFFKKIALNVEIHGLKFSITIFVILTFIVEKWLFGF